MAKKKTAPVLPDPAKGQVSVINLKGSDALKGWLTAESRRTHIPAAAIVRLGLAMWAKENGASPPPDK